MSDTRSEPRPCCCGGGGAATGPATESGLATEEVLALVERVVADPARRMELVPLLEEQHPVYRGRNAGFVADLRGWILIALGRAGLPGDALPFVLEELESGVEAYLVAAAARALRGYEQPTAAFVRFLKAAAANMRARDDTVTFERYGATRAMALGEGTTAMLEIATTLGWLGAHGHSALPALRALCRSERSPSLSARLLQAIEQIEAASALAETEAPALGRPSCCGAMRPPLPAPGAAVAAADPAAIRDLELQDHDGRYVRFGQFFSGRPSLVVFFYTRCDNPFKCPVTMGKLASFQALLQQEGLSDRVRTAAITYDPEFDLPQRLRGYGEAFGVRMGDDHRLLRTRGSFEALKAFFGLGVNYVDSIVNRHRLEAYILDERGQIARELSRLRWDEREVLGSVRDLLRPEPPPDGGPGDPEGKEPAPAQPVTPDPGPVAGSAGLAGSAAVPGRVAGLLAMVGAVVAAMLSSACCWVPLVLVTVGASTAGVSAFFDVYRPYLLTATAPLLGVGFYFLHFRRGRRGAEACCPMWSAGRRARFLQELLLWKAVVVVLLFALFPGWIGWVVRATATTAKAAEAPARESRLYRVEGLTCEGCAPASHPGN